MKSIVIANWKMNPASWREAKALFAATKKAADKAPKVGVVVAPPSLYLRELASGYRGKRLRFASQSARAENGGAHTGDISLAQIKDAGAKAAIIGHAERRAAGETNEDTQKQVATAIKASLTPILCVGEHERSQSGEHFTFVAQQLKAGFAGVSPSALGRVMVAYEPVWAIGAVAPMEPRQMHEMAIFIRKTIVENFGAGGHKVHILYGGAIDAENAAAMLQEGDVDGLLVGRASTDAKEFSALLSTIQQA